VQYAYRGAYPKALNEVIVAGMGTDSVYLWTLPMFHCNGWCFPWAVAAVAARHATMRGGSLARVGAHRRRGRDALPALMKPPASRRQPAQGSECLRRLWGESGVGSGLPYGLS
jgi:hypothetical protein